MDESDLSAYSLNYNAAPPKPAARRLFVFEGDNTGATDVSAELAKFILAAQSRVGHCISPRRALQARLAHSCARRHGAARRRLGARTRPACKQPRHRASLVLRHGRIRSAIRPGAYNSRPPSSGVRNIRVLYPEKSGTGNPECAFAIRSTDDGAYVVNCAVVGAYGGVDFNGANGHYVKKLIAYCYKYAVRAANCEGGIIETASNGTVAARNAMAGYDFSAWPDVNGYTQLRATLFYFYNTKPNTL